MLYWKDSVKASFILGKVYFEPIWTYWRWYACGLEGGDELAHAIE